MTHKLQELFRHDLYKLAPDTTWLIGVDEVGRGPLAGPVHAAGVAIRADWFRDEAHTCVFEKANDSKKLTASQRVDVYESLLEWIEPGGPIQLAVCASSVREIDAINILEATKLSMFRVLVELEGRLGDREGGIARSETSLFELEEAKLENVAPIKLMIDGRPLKHFPFAHEAIVKGDGVSLVIALASIAAKVERDAFMRDCHEEDSRFDWDKNKGYGTAFHREALLEHGPTSWHRRTFISKLLSHHSD